MRFNRIVLQHVAPEAGNLMVVANLNDVELLLHQPVSLELFGFEFRQDFFAEVYGDKVEESLCGFSVFGLSVERVGQTTDVVFFLEHSANSSFARLQGVDVILSGQLLLQQVGKLGFNQLTTFHSALKCLEVVQLTLDPVIDINERIAQVHRDVVHRLFQAVVVRMVDNQPLSIHVTVVGQIEVFVVLHNFLEPLESIHTVCLVSELASQVNLHLLQEGLGLLDEE